MGNRGIVKALAALEARELLRIGSPHSPAARMSKTPERIASASHSSLAAINPLALATLGNWRTAS
jgi:hypothetical protein